MPNHIQEMLAPENVRVVESAPDWRDAVRLACRPLVDGGFVEPRYPEEAIANAEKFGPYFVIAPDIALIHARPEQGVVRRQLAVTVVRQGVDFGSGKPPARLLVALAAEDPDSHIEVMRDLVALLSTPGAIASIAEAPTAGDIYRRFVG
ncbi:MAG: PTS sugar transporter subunit IIA [Atopobiaceae bacterium]|jgi:PTS system ascorbate-specific IIA component